MKNEKKISTILKAIQMLENGFEYDWNKQDACNCGVVSLAMGKKDVVKAVRAGFSWRWLDERRKEAPICEITGLFISDVQKAFLDASFTHQDIANLELLADKRVLKKIGVKHLAHDAKENLITYLRTWVELLTEEDEVESKLYNEKGELKELQQIRYIAIKVDKTIFEQAKSLIEN